MPSFQKKIGRRREPPTLRDGRGTERTTGTGIGQKITRKGEGRGGTRQDIAAEGTHTKYARTGNKGEEGPIRAGNGSCIKP